MKKIDQEQRAEEAWPILVDCAQLEQTITYKDLTTIMGIHHRTARYFLELIQQHCQTNELPPLSILVVNQEADQDQGSQNGI